MPKKLRIDGYRVVVDVPCEHHHRGNYTEEFARCEAAKIARAIVRHLAPYHSDCGDAPSVLQDAEPVCEFCGSKWTEGVDSEHNGGCCDKDTDVLRKIERIEEEEARERAIEGGQFGAGA